MLVEMNSTVNSQRPRVVILIGGVSGEHSISCLTAAGVLRNIDQERFDVVVVGITRTGDWVHLPADPAPLDGGKAEVPAHAPAVMLGRRGGVTHLLGIDGTDLGPVDVVFPLLHGPFGEDGTVQGLCEMLGVRYVGSGVFASAAGMDKYRTKVELAAAGLEVGTYQAVHADQWLADRDAVLERCQQMNLPLFVKPARAGSSLGISKVTAWEDLSAAIEEALQHDPRMIIEQGVQAREIEVAVLQGRDGQPPRVAPVGEVVMNLPPGAFYDWETKYFAHDDAVTMACPADLPAEHAQAIAAAAAQAFTVLGCEGLARVDFFYDGSSFLINEINTMPGMTPYSMYPFMWGKAGLSYRELVTELIEVALARPVGLR